MQSKCPKNGLKGNWLWEEVNREHSQTGQFTNLFYSCWSRRRFLRSFWCDFELLRYQNVQNFEPNLFCFMTKCAISSRLAVKSSAKFDCAVWYCLIRTVTSCFHLPGQVEQRPQSCQIPYQEVLLALSCGALQSLETGNTLKDGVTCLCSLVGSSVKDSLYPKLKTSLSP